MKIASPTHTQQRCMYMSLLTFQFARALNKLLAITSNSALVQSLILMRFSLLQANFVLANFKTCCQLCNIICTTFNDFRKKFHIPIQRAFAQGIANWKTAEPCSKCMYMRHGFCCIFIIKCIIYASAIEKNINHTLLFLEFNKLNLFTFSCHCCGTDIEMKTFLIYVR